MLSTARTGAWQAKQCDPGRTTDSPRGTRAMHTLRKLPQIAPHNPASATAPPDDSQARDSSTRQCYGARPGEARNQLYP